MFAGPSTLPAPGETWEWDGINWVQVFPAVSPLPRDEYAMAYDESRRVVVLVGGGRSIAMPWLDETWEWDGINWTKRSVAVSPGPRIRVRSGGAIHLRSSPAAAHRDTLAIA